MSDTPIKETQAAIERLMRWCAAKNKEPALPLEERAFVMDIEMVYTEAAKHFPEPRMNRHGMTTELSVLRKQRDAALKLADTWNAWTGSHIHRECASELRAIFAQEQP